MWINVRGELWRAMVVKIVDMERFEFGQRPGLRRRIFSFPIRPNVILSRLNKVYINSSPIRRYYSGIIDCYNLYRYTRCFGPGVRVRTIYSKDPTVLRDRYSPERSRKPFRNYI